MAAHAGAQTRPCTCHAYLLLVEHNHHTADEDALQAQRVGHLRVQNLVAAGAMSIKGRCMKTKMEVLGRLRVGQRPRSAGAVTAGLAFTAPARTHQISSTLMPISLFLLSFLPWAMVLQECWVEAQRSKVCLTRTVSAWRRRGAAATDPLVGQHQPQAQILLTDSGAHQMAPRGLRLLSRSLE